MSKLPVVPHVGSEPIDVGVGLRLEVASSDAVLELMHDDVGAHRVVLALHPVLVRIEHLCDAIKGLSGYRFIIGLSSVVCSRDQAD